MTVEVAWAIAKVLESELAACVAFDCYDEVHHAWLTFAVAGIASAGVVLFQWLGIAQIVKSGLALMGVAATEEMR